MKISFAKNSLFYPYRVNCSNLAHFSYCFIDLCHRMGYSVKTMIFLQKLVFTSIYTIDFWPYEGKTKFMRKIFSGKKMSFPLKFRILPTNGQGTSKNANIFKFLGDPIFIPYKDWFKIVFTFLPLKKLKSPPYNPLLLSVAKCSQMNR